MSSKKFLPLAFLLSLLVFVLFGCNMPAGKTPTQGDPGSIGTLAAQTVRAQLTSVATSMDILEQTDASQGGENAPQTSTSTPTTTETLLPTDTPSPPPSSTPEPQATVTDIPCDQMEFVKDVSIPDKTIMSPGEKFTKTWRLKNIGKCTWTSGYSLVFDSGDAMGAPAASQLTSGIVSQGDEYDVSVDLVAPASSGTYRGNFKLRNTDGVIFGIGDDSDPFWVEIVVQEKSGLMMDFITLAENAKWGSGAGSISYTLPGEIEIAYGSSSNTNGYVLPQDKIILEDGRKSGVILEMHPKMENDGYIIGRYPEYTVGAGDYFQAKIGFKADGNGNCGAGDAIFQILYSPADDLDNVTELGSWHENCDGIMRKININLGFLAGEEVRFYLIIYANGPSTDDLAIWDSPGITR